ncbi:MAG: polymer-forming cytoskeletal protein [Campylobacterales bacterium]|nr:polymer-forming cytoskeletal protein [Campylobacterales bacterium]
MGFFDSKSSAEVTSNTQSAKSGTMAFISKCMRVEGGVTGCGTLHVDGHIKGNVENFDTLIIGESGSVIGNIKVTQTIISGKVEGNIECNYLEVLQSGNLTSHITTDSAKIDGRLKADILAEKNIVIEKNGTVDAKMLQSPRISVLGSLKGKIVASELLSVSNSGKVDGEIIARNIKVEEGGRMLGSMSTYESEKPKKVEEPKQANAELKVVK